MSIFTVIMLAIISYFIIGGFILGLIDDSDHIMSYVWFWPVHIMMWLIELGTDLANSLKEIYSKLRERKK